ncbi:MAG: RNA-guided endonuclease InsQ/TnpB family protein [Acidimicrobiales bacterium]
MAVAGEQATLGVVWSRPLPSAPSSVTVYQDRAGRWWASFVVTLELPEAPLGPTGRCSGLDMGLTTFATAEDDAHDVANPGLARRAAKTLARSQANMARKLKISNHRAKARQQLARASAQVAHQRAGFHHKAARGLLGAYDVIGVEALVVKRCPGEPSRDIAGARRGSTVPSPMRAGPSSWPFCSGRQSRRARKPWCSRRRTPRGRAVTAGESQAPHRAVGPGVQVRLLWARPRAGPQRGQEPGPSPGPGRLGCTGQG